MLPDLRRSAAALLPRSDWRPALRDGPFELGSGAAPKQSSHAQSSRFKGSPEGRKRCIIQSNAQFYG
jgi:hypothetical protein